MKAIGTQLNILFQIYPLTGLQINDKNTNNKNHHKFQKQYQKYVKKFFNFLRKLFLSHDNFSDLDKIEIDYFENSGLFLVLVDENKIVGSGGIKHLDKEICELKRMWVLKEYRGQGYAKKMSNIICCQILPKKQAIEKQRRFMKRPRSMSLAQKTKNSN